MIIEISETLTLRNQAIIIDNTQIRNQQDDLFANPTPIIFMMGHILCFELDVCTPFGIYKVIPAVL